MSRMILTVTVVANTRGEVVRRVLEKLFEKHGVPAALLMDNGSPWISMRSRAGLTTLSTWLVSLGIKLHRSRPASPQDNGGHERMHRDLNELRLSPASSRRAQQPLCAKWALDFNHVRPHEALSNKTPAEVYGRPPVRPPVERVPTYPGGLHHSPRPLERRAHAERRPRLNRQALRGSPHRSALRRWPPLASFLLRERLGHDRDRWTRSCRHRIGSLQQQPSEPQRGPPAGDTCQRLVTEKVSAMS